MLFPTIDFAIFFSIVFALTWLLNDHNSLKKWFLVLCSYFFYGFWNTGYLLVLLGLSVSNFYLALLLDRSKQPSARAAFLWVGVAGNLATLAYFKYFNYFSAELLNLFSAIGLPIHAEFVEIAVPVAISFIIFHCLAYLIDVYKHRVVATGSLVDIMLYLSFFPHLVAGPIVRPASFLAQTRQKSDPEDINVGRSVLLIISGLFKKVIVASYLSTEFVDHVFRSPENFSSLDLLLGVYGYAIQIYCDFSAYTDIAIGVANLLGYQFPQNFNQPYRAQNLQEFWRRWHITLSRWLRDYLYIPLGGNQHGEWRTGVNILLTMGLGGLWHGASTNFIVWGLMHGVWLVADRHLKSADHLKRLCGSALGGVLAWLTTFHFVCFAWIFFRAPSLEVADTYVWALFQGGFSTTISPFAATVLVLGALTQIIPDRSFESWRARYEAASTASKLLVASVSIFTIAVAAPAGVPPFIYFQF